MGAPSGRSLGEDTSEAASEPSTSVTENPVPCRGRSERRSLGGGWPCVWGAAAETIRKGGRGQITWDPLGQVHESGPWSKYSGKSPEGFEKGRHTLASIFKRAQLLLWTE